MDHKERPNCRRVVLNLLTERNCTLESLVEGDAKYGISEAMRTQVKKMIQERNADNITDSN